MIGLGIGNPKPPHGEPTGFILAGLEQGVVLPGLPLGMAIGSVEMVGCSPKSIVGKDFCEVTNLGCESEKSAAFNVFLLVSTFWSKGFPFFSSSIGSVLSASPIVRDMVASRRNLSIITIHLYYSTLIDLRAETWPKSKFRLKFHNIIYLHPKRKCPMHASWQRGK